ncbi:dephospho-CoA kinase [Ceratobasidium sp. AG-Ba]|nr:dephospho-CoA kinase [Ceratobasidium sp. AG-Ba]
MDPAVVAAAVHELSTALLHIFASNDALVAGVGILVYDHILTFPEEVELIWKQNWSVVSTLFVLNRYITPLVLVVDVVDKGGLTSFLPRSFCVNWYFAEAAWNLVAFGMIHALVALRVRAIWGRPRWLTITLVILFVVYFVATAVIAFKFQADYADTVQYNKIFGICFARVSPYIWTCWLPALVFEFFVFILTVIKAFEHSRHKVNTPVVFVLYRDGIMYFVIICCCSMFNMLVWLLAPPTLVALSKYFVLCVVPTMGARLVLNLRGSRREDLMPTGASTSDHAVYELQAKALNTSSSQGRVVFVSRQEGGMSAQDRIQLNQMRSATDYQRIKEKKNSWPGV